MKTGVNPPRTPVTKGSQGLAIASIPNVCKMPGPPAPFVPTPLPNIGQSGDSLKKPTKKVKVEGKPVAIKGSSFKSKGDMASKGTGGGLVSATTHGATKFIAPGSMNVKFEGKNVQLLGDAMTNNNSNPPNASAVALAQAGSNIAKIEEALVEIAKDCEAEVENDPKYANARCCDKGTAKHACCDERVEEANAKKRADNGKAAGQNTYSEPAYNRGPPASMIGRNNPVSGGVPARVPRTQTAIRNQARGFATGGPGTRGVQATIGAFMSGKKFPDVVVTSDPTLPPNPGNVEAVYDFKFRCPSTKPPQWGSGGKQGQQYASMLNPNRAPRMVTPHGVFT